MKIQLKFESPLLIGGKKHSSNYIETDDVIKGSIIRAAFAKAILNRCAAKDEKDFNEKKNWVFYREVKSCDGCRFEGICKKFSDITFSYFYPKNTEVIPLSAKSCKLDDKHGVYDDLTCKDTSCNKCNGRLEFKSGLRLKDSKEDYKVRKSYYIKNGINPYTKTSKDGLLYSIETITGTNDKDENQELIYEGYIENMTKDDIKMFNILRVGGDTTVGLGKCTIQVCDELEQDRSFDKIKSYLEKFNEEYKSKNNKNKECDDKDENKKDQNDDNKYLAVVLKGDAILNFEDNGTYKTTDELKLIWQKAFNLKDSIKVEKVYTEMENYRGYDTSIAGINKRKESKSLVKKGTVIVFSAQSSLEKLYDSIMSIKNFGDEGINGFGQFEVYLGGVEYDK